MALPHEGVIKVSGVRKKIQIILSGLACKPSTMYIQNQYNKIKLIKIDYEIDQ